MISFWSESSVKLAIKNVKSDPSASASVGTSHGNAHFFSF